MEKTSDGSLVYTMAELCEVLKMGRNRSIKLVNTPGFPSIRNGNRWLIPKDLLKKWLDEQAGKGRENG